MRLFNKILIGFVVSVVVFLLVFFAVNLFDEAPTQLALEMEKPLPVYTVPDDENGFLLALAFNAPAEEDPVAYGRKIVDAWNWYVKNSTGSNEDYSVYESLLSNRSLKFTGERKHCAFTGADRCWQKITDEDRQETKRLLNDNQKLIERYRRLQTRPDYFNGMYLHPAYWQPIISFSLTDVCRVLGDAAMQNAKMGNVDDLLEFAGNDLSFWRRALSRHVSLIDDAIAQLGIEFDVALISELLADPSFDVATHEEELRLLLKPLDAIETNISPAIHREFLGLALFYRSTMGGDLVFNKYLRLLVLKENSLLRHKLGNSFFLHQQAVINRSSKYFAMAQKLASLPAREFLLERAVFKRKADIFFKENDVNNIFGFTWFYDYAGKWIANAFVTTPSTFESAIARAHNTAAYMLLVRAQLEIRLAGVPAAEVPEFLVGHPESFNPYTEQSFVWDGEQRTLSLVREPDTKILGSSESIQVSVP